MRKMLLLTLVIIGVGLTGMPFSFAQGEDDFQVGVPPGEGAATGAGEDLYGGGSLESGNNSNMEAEEENEFQENASEEEKPTPGENSEIEQGVNDSDIIERGGMEESGSDSGIVERGGMEEGEADSGIIER